MVFSWHRRAATVLVALAVLVFVACSPTRSHAGRAVAVSVRLRNFAIDLPASVGPGRTAFVIDGRGPTMHEFNIVRTALDPKDLPVDAGGLVDDQTPHADFTHLGEAEGIDIGDR